MITSKVLKDIFAEARPIIERHLDDAEMLAGMREAVAAHGGDWSSLKALIKAQIQDERDEAGDGKRVKKILDKADYSAAYADMLGLAKMNDGNNSADDEPTAEDVRGLFVQEVPHDPETGEIIEHPEVAPQATSEIVTGGESAAPSKPLMDIPDFLRRTKPQVEHA